MTLTSDLKRIDQAHYLLQRLEDEIVGYMERGSTSVHDIRLDIIRSRVMDIIHQLNEAYDMYGLPRPPINTTASDVKAGWGPELQHATQVVPGVYVEDQSHSIWISK